MRRGRHLSSARNFVKGPPSPCWTTAANLQCRWAENQYAGLNFSSSWAAALLPRDFSWIWNITNHISNHHQFEQSKHVYGWWKQACTKSKKKPSFNTSTRLSAYVSNFNLLTTRNIFKFFFSFHSENPMTWYKPTNSNNVTLKNTSIVNQIIEQHPPLSQNEVYTEQAASNSHNQLSQQANHVKEKYQSVAQLASVYAHHTHEHDTLILYCSHCMAPSHDVLLTQYFTQIKH